MQQASKAYKQAMKQRRRGRSYISIGIGIVNQEAQAGGSITGEFMPWSNTSIPLTSRDIPGTYATFEENFIKCDGSLYFIPESGQYMAQGITTKDFMQPVLINFSEPFAIKGLTLEFAPNNYPTSFKIEGENRSFIYENNQKVKFITYDVLGETTWVKITPLAMVGGAQRFRLNHIVMGVGVSYTDKNVDTVTINEYNNSVAAEIPSIEEKVTIWDTAGNYDVDDENSFINFLDTKHKKIIKIQVFCNVGK